MINVSRNHWLKKLIFFIGFFILILSFSSAAAASRDSAINEFKQALVNMGFDGDAQKFAEETVDGVIGVMEDSQSAIETKYDELKERKDSMHRKDTRKDAVSDALSKAGGKVDAFKGLDASSHVIVETQIGTIPKITPDKAFLDAEKEASDALGAVNKQLIAPSRPGNVPEGDILEDFVPQIIRQLFRFAWLAVFIAFVVSGVYFVISLDNEERITSAKRMIYFTLLGFAFVTLAFAIVKAVTDIDFFGFI